MKKLKLHLGSGNRHIEGYTNIDCRFLPEVDLVDNVRFLRSFGTETIDVIYASHILEHFSRWDYHSVLERWYELLKVGGVLRIAVPDFGEIAKYYLKTKNIRAVSGMLYGGQDYPENNHFWCWDFIAMKNDLESVGFKDIKRYDWRKTDHSHIDDYSQSYQPHMDKDNGTLLSLNILAVKI